jgi:glycosyltransferase involved in cell wall biosynthesis
MKKMRIAVFTDSFYPEINGATVSIRSNANILAKKGHEIRIFCPKYNTFDCYKKDVKTNLHPNIKLQRHFSFSLPTYKDVQVAVPNGSRIKKALDRFKPDIVHVHTFSFLGMCGARYAKKNRIPLVGTFHTLATEQLKYLSLSRLLGLEGLMRRNESEGPRKKSKYTGQRNEEDKNFLKNLTWRFLRRFYDKCNLVLTPSDTIRKELKKKGFIGPFRVVSNGINLSRFPTKKEYLRKNRLIFVGRLSYEKKIDVLLDALSMAKKKILDLELVICGDGPDRKRLAKTADLKKISRNVRFTGMVNNFDLHTQYHDSDAFITASTMETQGISILEAQSCGLPVIGVDKYAVPEIVKDNENGFICSPHDYRCISEKSIKIIKDHRLRKRMGRSARENAEKHDLKTCAEKLERTYLDLLD